MKASTLFLCMVIFCSCTCQSQINDKEIISVTIKADVFSIPDGKKDNKEIILEYPITTETISLQYGQGYNVYSISGLEKLPNLKKLYLGSSISDYSFLSQLNKIEILIIWESTRVPIDFSFLAKQKKLRILVLESVVIADGTLDLSENKELEYFSIARVSLWNVEDNDSRLNIIGGGDRIKVVNFFTPGNVYVTDASLKNFKNAKQIIISNVKKPFVGDVDASKKYKNLIYADDEYLHLPKEYQFIELLKIFDIKN